MDAETVQRWALALWLGSGAIGSWIILSSGLFGDVTVGLLLVGIFMILFGPANLASAAIMLGSDILHVVVWSLP